MFRLATCTLKARDVLLVEDDQHTAAAITASVKEAGGRVVGCVPAINAAVRAIETATPDMILLHTRYVCGLHGSVRKMLRDRDIGLEFLACFDEWFDLGDDSDDGDFLIASRK
jgi:DNA-binding NtrC family response regulator